MRQKIPGRMFRLPGDRIFVNLKVKLVKNGQNHLCSIQFSLVFSQESLILFDCDGAPGSANGF